MRELVGGGGEVSSVVLQLSQSAACLLCGVGGVRLSSTLASHMWDNQA